MELEQTRAYEGDYHYAYNNLQKEDIDKARGLAGEYHIKKAGSFQKGAAYDNEENPTWIQLGFADEGYLDIYGMELLEGRYPKSSGEIALEEWLLPYFRENRVGGQIELTRDGETDVYTIVGIFKDHAENKNNGVHYGFLLQDDTKEGDVYSLINTDESMDIEKQQEAFSEKFGYAGEALRNRSLLYNLNPKYDENRVDASISISASGFAESAWISLLELPL